MPAPFVLGLIIGWRRRLQNFNRYSLGCFPLMLKALNRDYSTPPLSLIKDCLYTGNIPRYSTKQRPS